MNKKIAVFSDLHLGVHQNSTFWLEQSVEWFKWFVNDLEENNNYDDIYIKFSDKMS